jgi:HK97 family phage prohead protease
MLEKLRGSIQAGDEGTFKAIASAAGSIAHGERGPTRFKKGAFSETLQASGGKYPLLWQHRDDQPIGVVQVVETGEGLVADGKIGMEVQQGKEAHALLKMGAVDGVSIGFNVKKAKHVTHKGESVREVEAAELAEVSLVTFPADKEARVTQVHSEVETEVKGLSSLVASLDNLAGHADEGQAGRVFSEANLKQIRGALGALVSLVEKVDPGHIASIGRRAARILKKSFIHAPGIKRRQARRAHSLRMGELRSEQIRLAYPAAVPEDQVPPARLFDDIVDEEEKREEEWRNQRALMDSINSIISDPRVGDKPQMVHDTVSQYLVAVGDAEVGDDDEESAADLGGAAKEKDAAAGSEETHVHDPRVEKRGKKWVVVDADGKVYGEHDTEDEANAQRRALRAAKDDE